MFDPRALILKASTFGVRLAPALGLVVALGIGCGPPRFVAPGHAEVQAFVEVQDPAEVRAAIIEGVNARRWQIRDEGDGRIDAYFGRGPTLWVAIHYDERGYRIQYVNSEGFRQAKDTQGRVLIDDRHVGWMRKLTRAIDHARTRRQTEHQEAVAAEREHEIELARAEQRTAQAERDRAALERLPPQQNHDANQGVGGSNPQATDPQGGTSGGLRAGFQVTRQPDGLGQATVVIINQSGQTIRGAQLIRPGSRGWGGNELARTIPPGHTRRLTGFDAGRWSIRLETIGKVKEWRGLHFGSGGEYTLVVTEPGWTWQ